MSTAIINQYYKKLIPELPRPVVENGIRLFESGGIQLKKITSESFISLDVPGNQEPFYNVYFRIIRKKIEPFCHCQYFGQNRNCKHVVAGLLFLNNRKQSADLKESSDKHGRKTSELLKIRIPDHYEDLKWLKPYFSNKSDWNYKIEKVSFTKNILSFRIKTFYRFQNDSGKTDLYREGNSLFTKCSCNKTVKTCCDHESAALHCR